MSSITSQLIGFNLKQIQPHIHQALITIPSKLVDPVFIEVSRCQKGFLDTYGFAKGTTPMEYIVKHYKTDIAEQSKEFIFKYMVLHCLLNKIQEKKLPVAGEPRLRDIELEPGKGAKFVFDLSLVPPITFKEWKVFAFKAPKRKKYKDIDRQVITLMQDEQAAEDKHTNKSISIGDWVCFDITPVDEKQMPLFKQIVETLWIKIGTEEADIPAQEAFVGKNLGQTFVASQICFQDYFCTHLDTAFSFEVTIKDILYEAFFDLELFKRHFRIKTNRDMQKKLIEVFSFRNDISQRRVMAEEALALLISKHPLQVPRHILLRQLEQVLSEVQDNPDYQVYRAENSFNDYLESLANKQAQEQILIDQLCHRERIVVTPKDVKSYINLLQRPRMKEFIYFTPPVTKQRGQEVPISNALMRKHCLREKTLNHIIYHLTKK
ncbi:MAG: trigger factor [Candidatus Babeliales bacterium]